jgi:phosphatidate phosphatase APP1
MGLAADHQIFLASCVLVLAGAGLRAEDRPPDAVRADEVVEFFPTLASPTADGGWLVRIHGWIYEPEADSLKRDAAVRAFRESLRLFDIATETPEARAILDQRARRFLVDNERGKKLPLRIGRSEILGPESDADGHFALTRVFSSAELIGDHAARDPGITVRAVLPASDPRVVEGTVFLIPARGLSIVSDIDDTIKITEVRDRSRLVFTTFCRKFEEAPGMAALYRDLSADPHRSVAFHYLSGSPYQLAAPLAEFMRDAGFPAGSLHLRRIRLKDKSALDMFDSPDLHKLAVLRDLADTWPSRRFLLIGDSGERDPEIYARFAREHPGRVERIAIRNVSHEARGAARYKEAFRDLPETLWIVFDPDAVPPSAEILSPTPEEPKP